MLPLLLTARTSTTGTWRVAERCLRADLVYHPRIHFGWCCTRSLQAACVWKLSKSTMDSLLSRFEGMKKFGPTKQSRDFAAFCSPSLATVLRCYCAQVPSHSTGSAQQCLSYNLAMWSVRVDSRLCLHFSGSPCFVCISNRDALIDCSSGQQVEFAVIPRPSA